MSWLRKRLPVPSLIAVLISRTMPPGEGRGSSISSKMLALTAGIPEEKCGGAEKERALDHDIADAMFPQLS